MRRAGVLIALAGCNWVYGLDATKPAPVVDSPPVIPGVPEHLAFLQLTGAGADPVDTEIGDLALLEASTLDGAQRTTLTLEAGGEIHVPPDIANSGAWRLVWQRAGGVVHEVQNAPANSHLIEPLYGPVVRAAPAAGQGYTITTTGTASMHVQNGIFTTGAWTEGTVVGGGAPLAYDLSQATSLASGPAAPGAGDKGLVIDYMIANGCRWSVGAGLFDASASGPPKVAVSAPWTSGGDQDVTIDTPLTVLDGQWFSVFGDESAAISHEDVGLLASTKMPAFQRATDFGLTARYLPGPVMISVRRCSLPLTGASQPFHTPPDLAQVLPRFVSTEVAVTRNVAGVAVANGISILTSETAGMRFSVTSQVAVAGSVSLGGTPLLTTSSDPIPSGAGPLMLTWTKLMNRGTANFWDVALLEVTGGALVERRRFTTVQPSLAIERADLVSGKTYLLRFTGHVGRGTAAVGDFRTVSGDQQISIMHTRSFVAP